MKDSEEKIGPKKVYKFRPINEHTSKIFCDKKLFFGYAEDFNDPFEFSMVLNLKNYKTSYSKLYSKKLNVRFTVFCVVGKESINNTLLWSHYADSHKGICIEFTPNYESSKSPFKNLEKVIYYDKIPKLRYESEGDLREFVIKVINAKAKCWEYENEWRSIIRKDFGEKVIISLENNLDIDKGRLHKFDSSTITKIILGCKISTQDERVVLKWVDDLGNSELIVEKCFKDKLDYKLKFKQIL